MQTSNVRRGHVPQISISDDNHHVTEAIGTLYDDAYYTKRESRPLSFLPSPLNDGFQSPATQPIPITSSMAFGPRKSLHRTTSNERSPTHVNGHGYGVGGRTNSFGHDNGPKSPPLPVRSPSDTANSSFPLNDIDYESNPAAVAQELSNLQALRRMSMDVNAAGDPDLPTFNSSFGMPTIAPTGSADEDDTSRLFWVPARLHPELAPKEFKTFLDTRVDSIKRRSAEYSLSPDGPERQGSGGGLRRKKSMLSRQIDNSGGRGAEGYQDGAERLDRKRSLSGADALNTGISNLLELEVLVNDPGKVIQRLSLDTGQKATGGEVPASEDMPILPTTPGNSLRRSTRTTYRRGSLRKSDRIPKRAPKSADTDTDEVSSASPITPANDLSDLTQVRPAPTPITERPTENFSRPARMNRARAILPEPVPAPPLDSAQTSFVTELKDKPTLKSPPAPISQASPVPVPPLPRQFVSQIASNGRSTIQPSRAVPQIVVETPPALDETRTAHPPSTISYLPQRIPSHEPSPSIPPQAPSTNGPPVVRGGKRPGLTRQNQSEKTNQTLKDMAAHPSPLPGNSTRTDSLSFIPTLTEDKKTESPKPAVRKEAIDSSKKSSWSWGSLLGNEEKEKEKRKEEEAREAASKKAKSKLSKPLEKSYDNTRLDVLQTTMESGRGRESLVLDRGDLKLQEERKKESTRKSSGGDTKKEKDSGLFSSFFGGKKKNERESYGRKVLRSLSPDPPHPVLKPDVDYNWTRFSILEERAIYRMAHIKLANPRRALYSQVLLSNFMYSYLAKVQQMHPQIQIPQTAVQKAQQRQQEQQSQPSPQQRKADQPEEYHQYQRYQEVNHLNDIDFILTDLRRQQQKLQDQAHGQPPASQGQSLALQHDGATYIEDASTYGREREDPDGRHRPQSRASQHSTHSIDSSNGHYGMNGGSQYHRGGTPQQSPYQYQQSQFEDARQSKDDEMW
ncbi:hypothetical protein MMC18_000442 [Xylographa bjoerkii]|nr:hypothetical protein [Xylographa bjoerkii]